MNTKNAPKTCSIETVAIVGVGLIGGSIGEAVRKRSLAKTVIGVGRNQSRLEAACQAGVIDEGTCDVLEAAARADLIVFCTPVDMIVSGVRQAARSARPNTLITDAGSVKASICEELSAGLPDGVTFVGSHPIAGSDKTGFENADAELFNDRVCVVTPGEQTPAEQINRLISFWRGLGMRVLDMPAAEHDRALALTSHLPHVVAAALALLVSDATQPLAGSGFADTTRIAAGSPDIWVPILFENSQQVLAATREFIDRLNKFNAAIEEQNAPALQTLLETAKTNRDALNGVESKTNAVGS